MGRSFWAPGQPTVRPLASGQWRSVHGAPVTASAAVNVERCLLLWLPPRLQLQAMACYVGTSAASTDLRMGVRADSNGLPGSLLVDAGTTAATGGTRSLPINIIVPDGPASGVPIWLTVTAQGTNAVTMIGTHPTTEYRDWATVGQAALNAGVATQNGVTGALPAGFTMASVTGPQPALAVQAA
ncbi:hypothetical protein [Verrucosispora sp. TAA-831]|uniref:hypothetical protein n=1 Tax=Verrucosispora sp. TAA-831 TaxID=3422227 RepID=UPI003D6FC3D8